MTKTSIFIRRFTPFITALVAIIHGVLYFSGYTGVLYRMMSEFTGHSILMMLFVYSTSKNMCKWYKLSVILQLLIHISNIMYYLGFVASKSVIYVSLVLNILALMCWLIFITTRNMSKAIRSSCIHSET